MRVNVLSETVCLIAFSAAVALGIQLVDSPKIGQCATIFVDGLCCDYMAERSTRELASVAGVLRASSSLQDRSIRLTLSEDQSVSPSELWQAATKASLRPTKLIVHERMYDSESLR